MNTWAKTLYWLRRLFGLRKKETPQVKAYREYSSKKLLEHQLTTLQRYDLDCRVSLPKNPEVLKELFPYFEGITREETASEGPGELTDEELIEKTWGREDPKGLFLKRWHEVAGSREELLKFVEVIVKVGGRLNRERGRDDSGKLLRDKPIPRDKEEP